MPATSLEPKRVCFLKADFQSRLRSTKEGVGETSGQTVGSSVSGLPRQPVRQKSTVRFIGGLRSMRISISATSPVASAPVRVDPDVFTDALVLPPVWLSPGVAFSRSLHLSHCRERRVAVIAPCVRCDSTRGRPQPAVAMVTGLPIATVNQILWMHKKPRRIRIFLIP